MAREIHIDAVDLIPRPVIAIGHDYPDGHRVKPHHHRRGQLISSATGVMVLSTGGGHVGHAPAPRNVDPPATEHRVQMVGAVSVQSLYIEPDAIPGLPSHCQVVGISPFMRSLITEALGLPLEYELEGRAGALMQLVQYEMQQLPALALSLRFPAHGPLSALCRQFVQEPTFMRRSTLGPMRSARAAALSRGCSGARRA